MKTCPECGSPEHPNWKAHTFVNTLNKLVERAVNTVPKERKPVNTDRHRGGYMRTYMAVRRAVGRGMACWWPEKPHAQ